VSAPEPPSRVLERSPHRARFLQHNRDTRDTAKARALLDAEWRYLGPLLQGRPQPRVLDLACGSGPFTFAWAERGAEAVGIDFDRGLLAAARDRLRPAARAPGGGAGREPAFCGGDATRLPFRTAAFDLVFSNSLLEHVPDWRAVLAETSRVLKPGGIAVIYTTNRWCPFQQEVNGFPLYSWLPGPVRRRVLAWIMAHRRDLVNWTDYPAIHWFSFPGMRRAFAAAGLRPVDRIDLMAERPGGGRRRLAAAMRRAPALKLPYYVYAISMAMYGIREPAASAPRPGPGTR
jgi:2-polyprenyl-6-hydroxyphenyl methylase/3-demethylubiquinone-9 3-methyltransferase